MSFWAGASRAAEIELLRLSQMPEGRQVLPNRVAFLLPRAMLRQDEPILSSVTAELGEALVAWARHEGHTWYRDLGPFLTVELGPVDRIEVHCEFVTEPPVTTGGSADRSGR